MRILPPPYDKYVFDIDTIDLYSLKTKHFNKIKRTINSSGEYCWQVIVNSRYHTETLTCTNALKLYENGKEYKEDNEEKFILKVEGNNTVQTFYYSLMSKLNADAMYYIKQGCIVKFYKLEGEFKLIPEKLELKT